MRFLIVVDYHCLRLDRISTLCNNCYGAGIFCSYLFSRACFASREVAIMLERENQEIYIRWLQQATSRSAVEKGFYKHAWEVAREAARILREHYAVSRIRAFGSLLHEERFHSGSDVDLAVEGLKPADYWEAVTSVMFLDDQVSVILIDQATCRPEIWEAVEQEGVDL